MNQLIDESKIDTKSKDREITELLKFVAEFLKVMDGYGQWDDGCFYYNGTSAEELALLIEMIPSRWR